MPVLHLKSIEDTTLWKQLKSGFTGDDANIAQTLASNLLGICEEAQDRMRAFPTLHPQYTLHDETHLLRVTELMAMVIPSDVLTGLNPIELTLLILSAHFHDQGMVLEKPELDALLNDPNFRIFRENWEIEHPNRRELRNRLSDKTLTEDARDNLRRIACELDAAMLTDFVRQTHAERSAEYVRARYGSDPRWNVAGVNIAELVARLCLSHFESAHKLRPENGFRFDECVGTYRINMVYAGLVLRLADIMDFDRDRTPDALYRTIDFTSRISLREWEKHRSVQGWVINRQLVQYTLRCEHPEYERAAREFMDWIDRELADAADIVRQFPAGFSKYRWELPLKADRSRIEPKNNAYVYSDLEFTLSRDEVVKLLMMDELYMGSWLCVRELLQNSLDALRYRRAMYKRDSGIEWPHGKVNFTHFRNSSGEEILRCADNGVGMDLEVVRRFLTNVGRSYYRSPEFEQERVAFRRAGADFDPCSQFGIGFMSCFMIGDRIRITTRRDYGPSRGLGDPLLVEINGLGGMVVIRPGDPGQQVGTVVDVSVRRKPGLIHPWTDNVRLIPMLKGYCLASEFPVQGECSVEGITGSVKIPPGFDRPQTILERAGVQGRITLEQSFSEIHTLLGGVVRTSFLTNESGQFVTRNSAASWEVSDHKPDRVELKTAKDALSFREQDSQTCIDGILVAGKPGRDPDEHLSLGSYGNPIYSSGSAFVLDVRGNIKPPVTPARVPVQNLMRIELQGKWGELGHFVSLANARIWERVAETCSRSEDYSLFWQLATIYSAPLLWMRRKVIWKHIAVPVTQDDKRYLWLKLERVGRIRATANDGDKILNLLDGSRVSAPPDLRKWDGWWYQIRSLLLSACALVGDGANMHFVPREPVDPDESPGELMMPSPFERPLVLPYAGDISTMFSSLMTIKTVNSQHPLVKLAVESRFLEEPSNLQQLGRSLLWQLTDPQTIEFVRPKPKKVPVHLKFSGALFCAMDWGEVAKEYAPPYYIRGQDGKPLEVTAEVLRSWAEAETTM